MKIKILTLFIFINFLCLSCSKNNADDSIIINTEKSQVDLSTFLSAYEIVEIDATDIYDSLKNQKGPVKRLSLLNGRYNFTVESTRLSLENEFYALNDLGEFEQITLEKTHALYLDNLNLQSDQKSVGIISRENALYIEFFDNDEAFVISALRELIPDASADQFIVFRQSDILESHESGSDCQIFGDRSSETNLNAADKSEIRSALYDVGTTVVIDYSMHNRLGWTGSINYVNDAMYMTNFRYNANSGLPISIIKSSGYVLNRSDQYGLSYSPSPTTYLNNYASWLSGYGIGNDVSILFTNDHAHWGAAYMNTVCGYYSVGLVEYHSWSTRRYNIIAHEIGHILGAGHTNSGVMRTVANGESSFTQYSKNQILNFLSSAGWCL